MVTADSDGKVNFWSMSNLRDPGETLNTKGNISSLAVAPETSTVIAGDECGTLFAIPASTGSSQGGAPRSSKRAIRKLSTDSHFGMVTALSTKRLNENRAGIAKGFLRGSSGMVLSAGVDWTIQLWAPAYSEKSLLSFVSHSYDYMCDVQWCVSSTNASARRLF